MKDIYKILIASVVLNLVLPQIAKPFATAEQKKPPTGAANLPIFGQLMHMLVHHAQVPFTSSAIVALIVYLSIEIAGRF